MITLFEETTSTKKYKKNASRECVDLEKKGGTRPDENGEKWLLIYVG